MSPIQGRMSAVLSGAATGVLRALGWWETDGRVRERSVGQVSPDGNSIVFDYTEWIADEPHDYQVTITIEPKPASPFQPERAEKERNS